MKNKLINCLICFVLVIFNLTLVGCKFNRDNEPPATENVIQLTNQEIIAKAIEKTEECILKAINGNDYTNPSDAFLNSTTTTNAQLSQKKILGFNVTSHENLDEEELKMGMLGATIRMYRNISSYLGIMDYILTHFTADDGYGIDLQYGKVYKHNDGTKSRYYKLIEKDNSIILLVNTAVLAVNYNESKTQVQSIKVIDISDYTSFVHLSEVFLDFVSNSFGENLTYSNGNFNDLSQDLKDKTLNFEKLCTYGFNTIQIMNINENNDYKIFMVEEGTNNDDTTNAKNTYNALHDKVKDVYDYYEDIMLENIQEDTVVFTDAIKFANSNITIYDLTEYYLCAFRIDYDNMLYILNKLKSNLSDVMYSDESWDDEKVMIDEFLDYIQARGKSKYTGFLSENGNCYGDFALSEDKSYIIAEFKKGDVSIHFEIKSDRNCTIVED